jgi:hypothetical protein
VDEAFSDIHIEQVRKSIDLKQWRRPDVSSLYKKQLVVFEGQLSTTFLNVIIDRKIFYQDNNACLLWIFKILNQQKKRRSSQCKILVTYFCNAIITRMILQSLNQLKQKFLL